MRTPSARQEGEATNVPVTMVTSEMVSGAARGRACLKVGLEFTEVSASHSTSVRFA